MSKQMEWAVWVVDQIDTETWMTFDGAMESARELARRAGYEERVRVLMRSGDERYTFTIEQAQIFWAATRGLVWTRVEGYRIHGEAGETTAKKAPTLERAWVRGGWVLRTPESTSLVFLPDPKHEWDLAQDDLWIGKLTESCKD